MPESKSQTAAAVANAELDESLPNVELEVTHGGRGTTYSLSHVDFLIGTVPGCDLRVPGTELPPVLCLLARQPQGLSLRKLSPTQVILVNGQTAARASLQDGDRVTLGAMDIFVRVKKGEVAAPPVKPPPANVPPADEAIAAEKAELQKQASQLRAQVVRFQEERRTFDKVKEQEQQAWQERNRDLEERELALAKRATALPNNPPAVRGDPFLEGELARKISEADAQAADLDKQRQDLATMRQELADIRRQLYERYQERRDRLAGLQEAVNVAARKVQDRKHQLEAEEQLARQRRHEDGARRSELDVRAAELAERSSRLDKERRLLEESRGAVAAELDEKLRDLQARETQAAEQHRDMETRQRQYQVDLVRLDRLQGTLDERDKQLTEAKRDFEAKLAQLQTDSVDFEEQVVQLDAWRSTLQEETDQFAKKNGEQQKLAADLAQRAAAIEGQQTTLAALRTRVERAREEVRVQEQLLDQERQRQQAAQTALEARERAVAEGKSQLESSQQLQDHERQQLTERAAVLEAAVSQLRHTQEKLDGQERALLQRNQELDDRAAQILDQEGTVQGRLQQLSEAQERLDQERQALRERTQALTQTELAREALQEQLRKRSEELAARQQALNEKLQDFEAQSAGIEARKAEAERQYQEGQVQLEARRQEQATLAAVLQAQQQEQAERLRHHEEQFEQVKALGREIAGQRKALADDRAAARREQETWAETQTQNRATLETLRHEAISLARQLPDVELRAGTALERLTHAREQLRDHLTELHAYVQECREDLESARGRMQSEEARLDEQEQTLHRNQEEHRLAMVAFRQQMIGWQGQIVDLRRLLTTDETRLERRQARVDEQAKEVGAVSEQLAQKAEALHQERHEVAGKRQEIDRHLVDMRQWYRQKLRELAGTNETPAEVKRAETEAATSSGPETADREDALVPTSRDILALTAPVDAGDRKLSELLTQLQLIDADTLGTLLSEARRQRRSLRQVLLASGAVTLYQLALIEAGNVAGLMLGPVRVIDRVRAAAHEVVYRVFDPRRGCEAVLRHLAEDDMLDAARPDEFRQRFTQAMIASPHLTTILEVLDIAGRPAVLQESVPGLPAGDWPPLAAAPGVCFRLLTQAALALETIHKAGLVHGNLSDADMLLTSDGTLKIAGAGEPAWLRAAPNGANASTVHGDLQALGAIVSNWCMRVRKGTKTKPLPVSLVAILDRLAAGADEGYASAADLLEDLDQAGSDVPANAEAWERLLRHVREHTAPAAAARRSA